MFTERQKIMGGTGTLDIKISQLIRS